MYENVQIGERVRPGVFRRGNFYLSGLGVTQAEKDAARETMNREQGSMENFRAKAAVLNAKPTRTPAEQTDLVKYLDAANRAEQRYNAAKAIYEGIGPSTQETGAQIALQKIVDDANAKAKADAIAADEARSRQIAAEETAKQRAEQDRINAERKARDEAALALKKKTEYEQRTAENTAAAERERARIAAEREAAAAAEAEAKRRAQAAIEAEAAERNRQHQLKIAHQEEEMNAWRQKEAERKAEQDRIRAQQIVDDQRREEELNRLARIEQMNLDAIARQKQIEEERDQQTKYELEHAGESKAAAIAGAGYSDDPIGNINKLVLAGNITAQEGTDALDQWFTAWGWYKLPDKVALLSRLSWFNKELPAFIAVPERIGRITDKQKMFELIGTLLSKVSEPERSLMLNAYNYYAQTSEPFDSIYNRMIQLVDRINRGLGLPAEVIAMPKTITTGPGARDADKPTLHIDENGFFLMDTPIGPVDITDVDRQTHIEPGGKIVVTGPGAIDADKPITAITAGIQASLQKALDYIKANPLVLAGAGVGALLLFTDIGRKKTTRRRRRY